MNSHRVESSSIKLAWPLTAGDSKLAFKENCQRVTLLQLFFSYPTPAQGFLCGNNKGNTPQAQTLAAFPFPASCPTCRPVSEQLRWGKMQCGSMVHWLVCVCVHVWFFQRHKLSTVTKAAEHVLTSKMQKKQSQSVRKQLFATELSPRSTNFSLICYWFSKLLTMVYNSIILHDTTRYINYYLVY